MGKQRIKENHYLKEYHIKIFPKWKIFLKDYVLRLKKTTTYLAELMKTKHKENLMEFEEYKVSEDYQVQRILLKDHICRKKRLLSTELYNRMLFISIKRNQKTMKCLQSTEEK